MVTIPGDVNGDLRVNSRDLNKLLTTYGAWPYDLNCDTDRDNKISPKDLNTLLVHYGQHYP